MFMLTVSKTYRSAPRPLHKAVFQQLVQACIELHEGGGARLELH